MRGLGRWGSFPVLSALSHGSGVFWSVLCAVGNRNFQIRERAHGVSSLYARVAMGRGNSISFGAGIINIMVL